jgi:hypothetical protein
MRVLLLALSLALVGRPLTAQQPSELPAQTRLRVVLPDSARQAWFTPRQQWIHGKLAVMAPDTLYLQIHGTAAPVAIPRKMIKRADRSLGVPSRPASAIQGAVGSAILGALYGILLRGSRAEDWRHRSVREAAALGAGMGAGIGFILGAIFPTERWRRVRLR